MKQATVVGAGLAGSEAAFQLAERGVAVTLIEMKPEKRTPAHTSDAFAELVCSNSLRSDQLSNAVGLLKEELRQLGSLIIACADQTRVPAGGALAVDREGFAALVTERLLAHPNISIQCREVTSLPDAPAVIATGPLTTDALAGDIARFAGKDSLYFFDAAAPIVTLESLDMDKVFRASRYDKGDADYLNCPMNADEYEAFWQALTSAETAHLHEFENNKVFEGCMPVEVMASRGHDTLAYGMLKPVGLTDPRTGKRPHAVVQLRQDDAAGRLYNLVGFQTHLKFPEQKRVFSMIPGLEKAEFVRYGVMHRNTYLNAPGLLSPCFLAKGTDKLYFAGQMTGVEGYVESTASGLMAGIALARSLCGHETPPAPADTAIGALSAYIASPNAHFQPMNVNYGLFPALEKRVSGKRNRYEAYARRALESLGVWREQLAMEEAR